MIPRSFEYYAPESLPKALWLLKKYRDDAKILAGGHSLTPVMKLRLASPKYIVDINRIPKLAYIKTSGKKLLFGTLTRHYQVETSDTVKKLFPILSDAASVIGDPQVRNLGTIGGAVAHADPAADYAGALLALGAAVKSVGPKGRRTIKIDDFFVDTFTTALKPNEILTEIQVPIPPARSGGAYLKLERRVGDFATVGVGVQLTLAEDGVCKTAGIGLVAAGPTPLRARKAEETLKGRVIGDEAIKEASVKAMEESDPIADLRGSVEYKRDMVRVFTKRSLQAALKRVKEAAK